MSRPLSPLHEADRAQANTDSTVLNRVQTAAAALQKARNVYLVAETLETLDDPTREQLRKLRARARSAIAQAYEEVCR